MAECIHLLEFIYVHTIESARPFEIQRVWTHLGAEDRTVSFNCTHAVQVYSYLHHTMAIHVPKEVIP